VVVVVLIRRGSGKAVMRPGEDVIGRDSNRRPGSTISPRRLRVYSGRGKGVRDPEEVEV
jgi:hypothetical protein